GRWATRIRSTMGLAALIGTASVAVGLLISWHAGTAAGATIAFVAILAAAISAALRNLVSARVLRRFRIRPERNS
ncbi:MAG TPA: ABC transporter permease, partial [Microbacterium sp.]|nr:ABC transporter permease [Microbacterium sp.]